MNKFLKSFLFPLIVVLIASGMMSSMSYATEGWCCKDGYVFKSTDDECLEKGGKFFLTEKEAIKYCTYVDYGWCCLDGAVYKSTPEICREKGGVYFVTEAAAKKYCETGEESGWCCLDGVVFPATPEVCKKKGGVYFTTEAAAKKYCETGEESGWCCLDGMVFPATPEVCKKKGGVYFTTEAAAKKYCETAEESGWCCLDGVVFPATPEVCKKKGGMFFLTKAEALKDCDSAAELPDLEVVNIFLTKKCEVAVKVKNNGPGMVPDSVWTIHTPKSSSVYIYINGKSWGGATIWKFDPGKSLKAPGGTAVYISTLIVKTEAKIVATIDHTLQVAETNETNNKMGKFVKCGLKMLKTKRVR